jgi:hypothetical protein
MKQQGGTLEPLLKTPKFTYTVDPGRKMWTKALYPYAPYFFDVVKNIHWNKFKYENENTIAVCSAVPYNFFGGSCLELYYRDIQKRFPDKLKYRLHDFVDPTGDIDIDVQSLLVKNKTDMNFIEPYTIVMPGSSKFSQLYDNYTMWLFDEVVAYFQTLVPNYKEWFPLSTNQNNFVAPNISTNVEAAQADRAYTVGPFTIVRVLFVNHNDIRQSMAKIQVVMSIEIGRTGGQPTYYTSHFMELVLNQNGVEIKPNMSINAINRKLVENSYKSIDGYWLSNMDQEFRRNYSALTKRISLYHDPLYKHKFLNHLFRGLFMLILKDVVDSENLVGFRDLTKNDVKLFYGMFMDILYSPIGPELKSSSLLQPFKKHFLNSGQDPNLQPNIIRNIVLNLPPIKNSVLPSNNNSFQNINLGNNNSTSISSINNISVNSNNFNRFLNNNRIAGGFRKTRRRSKKSKRSRHIKRTRV